MPDEAPWWAGTTSEYMNIGGPFATREEAIKAGRDEQCGEPFCVIQARLHKWGAPDASAVIDQWVEQSDEYFFEDGFDGFVGGSHAEKAAEEDLQAVLNAWFERHKYICPAPNALAWSGNEEIIDAAEQEAAA
jgi:hypothetical protein